MRNLILPSLLALTGIMYAHALTVKGTVTDQGNNTLPGVTIQVTGTNNFVVTDYDGNYTLNDVADNAILRFSFVGTKPVDEPVKGRTVVNVMLYDELYLLNEVVVIGYGSAKAKDLTSPIAVVKGDQLSSIPTSSPMAAIQGKVPGVQVMNAGSPGSSPTIRIRGTGSFSNSNPLYVVDGVYYNNIDFLNNDDIEEISILKDASASAIYGVKAANGVVLVTTKKGRANMPPRVTYNGYVGLQTVTKRLQMANAHEYATMLTDVSESAYRPVLEGAAYLWGGDYDNLRFDTDTDWYDQLLRNAVTTNHSLSIAGGGEKARYSMGMSYFYQDGIMNMENNYRRLNFRGQLDFDVTKWLTTGFNAVLVQSNSKSPNNDAWNLAFTTPAILPVYDENRDDAFPEKFASASQIGIVNNVLNPVAAMRYGRSSTKGNNYLMNVYADFKLIADKLNFRTSYGKDFGNFSDRWFQEAFMVGPAQQSPTSSITKGQTDFNNWLWDNVMTYKDSWGKHNFGAMAGYSMHETSNWGVSAWANDVPEEKEEYWYVKNGDAETAKGSDSGERYRSQSIFGRLNYDYDSRYLLMFTMRADGSSKYQEKWGYFPSVGAAWVISEEAFMEDQATVNFLKLRASWGQLGNDNVAASAGVASIRTGLEASGVFGNNTYTGYQNTSYFSWLKWEVVNETNVGVSLQMLDSRFDMDIDYFYRLTDNAVIGAKIPFSPHTLAGNYGKIENSGFEFSLNWSDRIGDFRYSVGGNVSAIRNRIKSLQGPKYIQGDDITQMVGEKMNSFYGYKVIGVYQTEEEVAADPIAVANGFKPGFLKFENVNGDDVLDAADYQVLGSYIPDVTYNINLNLGYKNFDLAVSMYGQAGGELYNSKRKLHYASAYYNFDHAQYADRWHGPGTSTMNPSAEALMNSWTTDTKNSYFVESADFFRIQNIALGYTLRNIKMGSYVLPSVRFSLNADRPFTFFKAHSFTPEISDPVGMDNNVYPLASTYTFGLQIEF